MEAAGAGRDQPVAPLALRPRPRRRCYIVLEHLTGGAARAASQGGRRGPLAAQGHGWRIFGTHRRLGSRARTGVCAGGRAGPVPAGPFRLAGGGGARRQPCATAVGGGCLNQASPRADPPSRVAAAARPVASRAKRLTCCIDCLRRSRVVRVLQEPSRRGQRRLSSARRRVGFALEHSLSLREVGIGPGFGAGRGASADTSGRAPPGCWRRSRFSRAAASACRLLIEADPCCIGCASLPGA